MENYYGKDCITESAEVLNDSLKNVHFGLDDKFCDVNDLKDSYEKTKIPEPFKLFFSKLFNLDKNFFSSEETSNSINDLRTLKKKLSCLRSKVYFRQFILLNMSN